MTKNRKEKEETPCHPKNRCQTLKKSNDLKGFSHIEDLGVGKNFTLKQEEIFKTELQMVHSASVTSDTKTNWTAEYKNTSMTVNQLEIKTASNIR